MLYFYQSFGQSIMEVDSKGKNERAVRRRGRNEDGRNEGKLAQTRPMSAKRRNGSSFETSEGDRSSSETAQADLMTRYSASVDKNGKESSLFNNINGGKMKDGCTSTTNRATGEWPNELSRTNPNDVLFDQIRKSASVGFRAVHNIVRKPKRKGDASQSTMAGHKKHKEESHNDSDSRDYVMFSENISTKKKKKSAIERRRLANAQKALDAIFGSSRNWQGEEIEVNPEVRTVPDSANTPHLFSPELSALDSSSVQEETVSEDEEEENPPETKLQKLIQTLQSHQAETYKRQESSSTSPSSRNSSSSIKEINSEGQNANQIQPQYLVMDPSGMWMPVMIPTADSSPPQFVTLMASQSSRNVKDKTRRSRNKEEDTSDTVDVDTESGMTQAEEVLWEESLRVMQSEADRLRSEADKIQNNLDDIRNLISNRKDQEKSLGIGTSIGKNM